ncbi:MAG TPA: adenylate/guanylate cyclase domain-containing protein, partial [Candidatus Deferrimicrobium sp.]|nr:adenylate/guanylate cyclase domain-containing protein [Candidatus Deferrimicrobium sp.]
MIEPTTDGDPGATRPAEEDHWRALLTGEDPSLKSLRRIWGRIPTGPRCKVCAAPFHGPGRILTRVVLHGQSVVNPTMCQLCFRQLAGHPGGAEIDISIVFADVRGSTGLAETMGAGSFREALQTFYGLAAQAIEGHGGFVDKYLGDGIMALFIPVLAGEAHADRAVAAALELVASVESSRLPVSGFRVGAGVHRGSAFVGVLGSGDKLDFSALGDPVNVAARLGSIAGPGEVLVSRDAWTASGRGGEAG